MASIELRFPWRPAEAARLARRIARPREGLDALRGVVILLGLALVARAAPGPWLLVPPLLAVLALAAGVLERRGAGAASEARLALGPGGLTIERGAGRTRLDRERVVRWYALPEGVVLEATAPGGPRRLLLSVPDATLAPEERSGLRESCEALFGAPTTPPARHRWLRIALVPALLIEVAMLAFNYSVGAP